MRGTSSPSPAPIVPAQTSSGRRLLLLALFLVTATLLYFYARDRVTLQQLAAHEQEWRAVQQQHPWLVYAAAFGIYAMATGLSLPIATTLTLAYAWYFGFWPALVLVNVASTAGATFAMLMSRYVLRETIRSRYRDAWIKMEERWTSEGPWYLLTLRLVPIFPFFLVNVLMGLTPIRVRTYWWVSQVGMLPATAVYTYAGATVPSLKALANDGVPSILNARLAIAFGLLGLFPLAARWLLAAARKHRNESNEAFRA